MEAMWSEEALEVLILGLAAPGAIVGIGGLLIDRFKHRLRWRRY